jgi:nitrite reductase/ring-hydroxylating ferredoxin subunit
MRDDPNDPRDPVDARLDTPGREGLTGTAPADLYAAARERETVTIAPDFRPAEDQPGWRQDFPIDWPQDHYVERRDFMKFLVLTSLAFTAGQFWIGVQQHLRAREAAPEPRRIAGLADLPVGGTVVFEYPGEHDRCVLVRPSPAELVAYSQKCTHLACAVIPRPEQGILHCPCHAGYFDLATGRVISGPPQRPLPRVLIEVRGDDVFATGIEWRTS